MRQAAAARRRQKVIESAKHCFEQRGWSGTTVRQISDEADVSQKTVEALFRTKAALLQAAVDYAIRGDTESTEMPQRESVARMEAAPTSASMLTLHASHVRKIVERSARVAGVVEQAATSDGSVAELWQRMNHNRGVGVRWATNTFLHKPGRKRGLRRKTIEATFWVALDWGTFRTLTEQAGLSADDFEAWLRSYYTSMLLAHRTVA